MGTSKLTPALLRHWVGPLKDPVSLDPVVRSATNCDGYVRYHLAYNVPSGAASCFICVPEGLTQRTPIVFCHHQHARQFGLGKSEVCGLTGDPNQAYAAELAEQGFITVSPDAIGFEDRNWSGDRDVTWFELSQRIVVGRTLLADCLQEVSLAIDVALGVFPFADATRVGFIGHSYGGRMAIWAPAWDSRIQASVSNCGCIPYRLSHTHDTGVQAEFVVPGFAAALDIEDVFQAADQCHFLVMAAEGDRWSRGARDIEARLAAPEGHHVRFEHRPGGHDFPIESRRRAYSHLSSRLA